MLLVDLPLGVQSLLKWHQTQQLACVLPYDWLLQIQTGLNKLYDLKTQDVDRRPLHHPRLNCGSLRGIQKTNSGRRSMKQRATCVWYQQVVGSFQEIIIVNHTSHLWTQLSCACALHGSLQAITSRSTNNRCFYQWFILSRLLRLRLNTDKGKLVMSPRCHAVSSTSKILRKQTNFAHEGFTDQWT